jgi:hypothetical protein
MLLIRPYPSPRLRIPTIQEEDHAGTKRNIGARGFVLPSVCSIAAIAGESGAISCEPQLRAILLREIGRVRGEMEQPLRRKYSRITVSGLFWQEAV